MKIDISKVPYKIKIHENLAESFYSNNHDFLSISFNITMMYSEVVIRGLSMTDWMSEFKELDLTLYPANANITKV